MPWEKPVKTVKEWIEGQSRLSAADYNAIAKRVARDRYRLPIGTGGATASVTSEGRQIYPLDPKEMWLGVTVNTENNPSGGGGPTDFTDHRYYVWIARAEDETTGIYDAMELGTVPNTQPEYRVVPVTNLAEEQTRGHLLPMNYPVIVYSTFNRATTRTKRYYMVAHPPQPFLWMEITDSTAISSNRWQYTGLPRPLAESGWDVSVQGPGTITTLFNSIEFNNTLGSLDSR